MRNFEHLFAAVLVLCAACSGNEESGAGAQSGGSAGAASAAGTAGSSDAAVGETGPDSQSPVAYVPKANGKPMSEAQACATLRDAIATSSQKLSCSGISTSCPDYIRASVPNYEACLQFDEGTIVGCAEFYASFTSCDDFTHRPCIIAYLKGSAPAGCPSDASTD